jgi:MYM-type Zinc finger with FCS sequence motif
MTTDAGLKVTCESCGKSFHVKPSRLKNGSRPRFCSIACRTFARNPVRAQRLYPAETADKHRLLPRGRIERSGQIQNGDLKRGA